MGVVVVVVVVVVACFTVALAKTGFWPKTAYDHLLIASFIVYLLVHFAIGWILAVLCVCVWHEHCCVPL